MITLESLNKMLAKPDCFKKVTAARRTKDFEREISKPKDKTLAIVEQALKRVGVSTRPDLVANTGLSKDTVKKCTDWLHANNSVAKRHIGNVGDSKIFEYKMRVKCLDGVWI